MRRQAVPVFVPNGIESSAVLQQCKLRDNGLYDEAWIQGLIHAHPNVLPVWGLEPAFWPAVAVCRELGLPSGNLDNLLLTPNGDLILVECKLWRNPQARREVVAQVIDYAKDLKNLDYSKLEQAVAQARGESASRLYGLVETELDENEFVDNVTRNLRRGRALLIVAGDGITENVETIADFLQQHAGMHFTFALVQLGVYDLPNGGGLIVVPSVPMHSTNVVRGIVETRDATVEIAPPPDTARARRATNLTEEEFLRGLDAIRPGTSERLLALVERGEDIGLYSEVKKSLIVKMPWGDNYTNILLVRPDGSLDFSQVWWQRDELGDATIRRYIAAILEAMPGITLNATPTGGNLRMADRPVRIWDVLDHSDVWLEAVRRFREAALAARAPVI